MKLHYLVPKGDKLDILFTQHKDSIIKFTSIPRDYDRLAQNFVKDYANDFKSFRKIKFPFNGWKVVDNIEDIFEILPEFICSLVEIGYERLISLGAKKNLVISKSTSLSIDSINDVSALLYQTLKLTIDFLNSGNRDSDLRNQIYDNLDLIEINQPHTDIFGCFQIIHEHIYTLVKRPDSSDDIDGPDKRTNVRLTNYRASENKDSLLEYIVRPIRDSLHVLDPLIKFGFKSEQTAVETNPKKQQIKNLFLKVDNLKWEEIKFLLKTDQVVLIKAREYSRRCSYTELGMNDGRKTDMPTKLWQLLVTFAENKGEIPLPNNTMFFEKSVLETTVYRLRTKLMHITGLKSNPISNFHPTDSYITYFTIHDQRPGQYHKDIAQKQDFDNNIEMDMLYIDEERDDQDQIKDLDYYDSQPDNDGIDELY